jgi:hypothetical protein
MFTEKKDLPLGVDTDEFAVLALNHLARSFQQCRDTQTMDAFSLAMQVDMFYCNDMSKIFRGLVINRVASLDIPCLVACKLLGCSPACGV